MGYSTTAQTGEKSINQAYIVGKELQSCSGLKFFQMTKYAIGKYFDKGILEIADNGLIFLRNNKGEFVEYR